MWWVAAAGYENVGILWMGCAYGKENVGDGGTVERFGAELLRGASRLVSMRGRLVGDIEDSLESIPAADVVGNECERCWGTREGKAEGAPILPTGGNWGLQKMKLRMGTRVV